MGRGDLSIGHKLGLFMTILYIATGKHIGSPDPKEASLGLLSDPLLPDGDLLFDDDIHLPLDIEAQDTYAILSDYDRVGKPPDSQNAGVLGKDSNPYQQQVDSATDTARVPLEYIFRLDVGVPVGWLTPSDLAVLRKAMSDVLGVSAVQVVFDTAWSSGSTLGMYLVDESDAPVRPSDLSLDDVNPRHHIVLRASGLPADPVGWWRRPHMPVVMAALAAVLVLGLAGAIIWCCVRRRIAKSSSADEHGSSATSPLPQQICLYPSAKPNVHNATLIQPHASPLGAPRGGGCVTPVHGSGCSSPNTYSSSSTSGTPLYGTPVHTPPMRLRRGLLERRGSNASLTIDLGTAAPSTDQSKVGTPPKESSAEEYLLSAGHRMTRRELRGCLNNVKALYEEFWEIPMNHPDKVEVAGSGMKNRYRTIIPNESTRVRLAEVDNDPLTSYINANYIRGYCSRPRAYIATQGPMSNTVDDFWRMVWQERAPIIVMITKLKEKNRTKCESYLPERYAKFAGNLEVFVHSISDRDGYILRDITLKCGSAEHRVSHYWYTAWPDHKAPSTARSLLDLVNTVAAADSRDAGPTIVHCSAGIGRTGCFIATSIGVQQLREERSVDVLGIVCAMRVDRGGMVQTNEQYEFVHQALSLYERDFPDRLPSASGD